MICEFCGNDKATDHHVATKLGRAAVLCKQCQTKYGVQPSRKTKRSSKAMKKGQRSKDRSGQMFFSFYLTETGSPAEATRF